MGFTKRLHEPIARGEVTCTVRIWQRPHVKVGGRYRLGAGAVEVMAIREIGLAEITPDLARRSGFGFRIPRRRRCLARRPCRHCAAAAPLSRHETLVRRSSVRGATTLAWRGR
jgi:hypothetical protein